VQIVGKNSVKSHLPEWKETCIEKSYDVTNDNYLSFGVNKNQLITKASFEYRQRKLEMRKTRIRLKIEIEVRLEFDQTKFTKVESDFFF